MSRASFLLSTAFLCGLSVGCARAQTPPTYQAAACKIAPNVDGMDRPGEWDGATRVPVSLAMKSPKSGDRPARSAELRLMSSGKNLYVAFRVPDAARDLNLGAGTADIVILAFCRGDEIAAGDDRRVMLPGVFADKHYLSPGKDADDPQRDGQGMMRWRRTASGGEYFIEWQVPLNSGDKNDIAAAPGGKLRFNLVFGDRFSPTLAETEMGGLFGVDTDHAKGWGTLVLAENVGEEQPAPAPEWLTKLFPHTGKPDRLEHRLRRTEANEFDAGGKTAGAVTVEFTFPNLDGKDETGQGRIFLPPVLQEDPSRRVPLIHVAGYEINEEGAAGLLAKGYAVSTPHAHPLNPLGRGVNLDTALLHAARRLSCIDPLRVSIQGGSAGGWMTLMLTADAFPLVWSMPDVPPIHWGYNAAYIGENQKLAGPAAGSDKPRLPGVAIVAVVADQAKAHYGMPFESPAYLATSPLAHLDTITAPTLTTFTTADLLVPFNQVSPTLIKPFDPKLFPEGFWNTLPDRFPSVNRKRTLLEVLPADRYQLFILPATENPSRLGPDGAPSGPAKPLVLPFSQHKVWSIVVLDEGAPEPAVGHFKYFWGIDHEPFRLWAEAQGVKAEQLTSPKLERLMKRLRGEPWRPLRVKPGGQGEERAGNVLDYPEAERADVLLGLTAFASDDARAVHLAKLYAALPAGLKALGERLGNGSAASVRDALKAQAARPASK